MNINAMMKQAQQMQKKMGEINAQVDAMEFTETAGGVVEVVVNGKREIIKLEIKEDILEPSEKEMLQDLIMIAVNKASNAAAAAREEKLGAVTGGMGMPF